NRVPAAAQLELLRDARTLIERATRWLLRRRPRPLDIAVVVDELSGGVAALGRELPGLLVGDDRSRWEERAAELREAGVPDDVAARGASLDLLFPALDVVDVAAESHRTVEEVGEIHFHL